MATDIHITLKDRADARTARLIQTKSLTKKGVKYEDCHDTLYRECNPAIIA